MRASPATSGPAVVARVVSSAISPASVAYWATPKVAASSAGRAIVPTPNPRPNSPTNTTAPAVEEPARQQDQHADALQGEHRRGDHA